MISTVAKEKGCPARHPQQSTPLQARIAAKEGSGGAAEGKEKIPSFAQVRALPFGELLPRFAAQAVVGQRAFSTMAKIYRRLQSEIEPPQTVGGELRRAGVKKSTVNNAAYAAKVFRLVESGHLTEAEFDDLSFGSCVIIRRAMSTSSRRQIDAGEVAAVIRANPAAYESDFTSIYMSGSARTPQAAKCTNVARSRRHATPLLPPVGSAGRAAHRAQRSDDEPASVATLAETPRVELGRLLERAQFDMTEARLALARLRRDCPLDGHITVALGAISRLRLALNEGDI